MRSITRALRAAGHFLVPKFRADGALTTPATGIGELSWGYAPATPPLAICASDTSAPIGRLESEPAPIAGPFKIPSFRGFPAPALHAAP